MDRVVKLQLNTTLVGSTPTAWPICRCALVGRYAALAVGSVMELQSAGAALRVA